jgi:hypothetical protein
LGIPEASDLPYLDDSKYRDLVSTFKGIHRQKTKPLIYEYIQATDNIQKCVLQLILSCLSYNPIKRPQLDNLLQKVICLKDMNIPVLTKEVKPDSSVKPVKSNRVGAHTHKGFTVNMPYITDLSDLENNKKFNETEIPTFRPKTSSTNEYQELNNGNIFN